MVCDSTLYGTVWEMVGNNTITLSIDILDIERILTIWSIFNLIYCVLSPLFCQINYQQNTSVESVTITVEEKGSLKWD